MTISRRGFVRLGAAAAAGVAARAASPVGAGRITIDDVEAGRFGKANA